MRLLAAPALLLLACVPILAQRPSAADVAAGQKLFDNSCTACHGGNARGGRAPNLTTGNWRRGGSDAEILHNILAGIPNTEMPAFPMPTAQGEQIVAYLRSLSPKTSPEDLKGDAAAGRQLFFGSAGCSRCHMYAGNGGRLGPDLSVPMGARRVVNLRKAITDPDESLRPNYQTVEAVRPDRTFRYREPPPRRNSEWAVPDSLPSGARQRSAGLHCKDRPRAACW